MPESLKRVQQTGTCDRYKSRAYSLKQKYNNESKKVKLLITIFFVNPTSKGMQTNKMSNKRQLIIW